MKSKTVPPFWELYEMLPESVQILAQKAYRLWLLNPSAKGLNYKRVCDAEPVYSIRIGRAYRALGLMEEDTMYWFFIGTHDAYQRQLKKMS